MLPCVGYKTNVKGYIKQQLKHMQYIQKMTTNLNLIIQSSCHVQKGNTILIHKIGERGYILR